MDLLHFIEVLELCLGGKAQMNFLPLQQGDVPDTLADVDALTRDNGYRAGTHVEEDVKRFVEWYRSYYHPRQRHSVRSRCPNLALRLPFGRICNGTPMDSDSYAVHAQDEGIDLVVLWLVLKRYKVFIAIFTAVVAIVRRFLRHGDTDVSGGSRRSPRCTIRIWGVAGAVAGQLGGLASLAGVTLGAGSGQSRDAQAILKSRRLAQQFIERYDLTGKIMAKSSAPPTLWRAVARFRKYVLNVDEDRRNGVTTVSIYWRDPKEAALWANNFVALGNELIRNRAAADAQRNIGYLNEQLKQTSSVEVQHAMYNLVESETKTLMLATGRAEYAFSTIDPAVTPELSASPKVAIIILVGVVGGIFTVY